MECPSYLLSKIQTVKKFTHFLGRQAKGKLIRQPPFCREICTNTRQRWWMEEGDPTEASFEWFLGPAIGDHNTRDQRETEFRDKILNKSVLLRKVAFSKYISRFTIC